MLTWRQTSRIAAVSLVFIFLIVFLSRRREGARQPIAYNHKKHIELGLECGQCHTGIVEKKAHASLPDLATCLTCHAEDDNPKTAIIRTYAKENKPIPWVRIYRVSEHVYFSHARHVELAKLDCAVCHGDMSKKEAPVTRQAIKISMGRCLACHRARRVTSDCLACHR